MRLSNTKILNFFLYNSIFSTSYSFEPPGEYTSPLSSIFLPSRARASGEEIDILPFLHLLLQFQQFGILFSFLSPSVTVAPKITLLLLFL